MPGDEYFDELTGTVWSMRLEGLDPGLVDIDEEWYQEW